MKLRRLCSMRRLLNNERGTWAAIAAAVITTGGSIYAGSQSGKNKTNPEDYLVYKQLPDYPESEQARKEWLSRLMSWGGEGANYGATDMNWEEIFNTAKDKINRYYWGDALGGGGLSGKVKASAARRNVSQSPALENQLTAMGFQQSQDLSDLYSGLTTQKAQYTESARNTWLSSLMNLAGLKPSYVTGTGAVSGSSTYGAGNMVGDISSGLSSLFSQYSQQQWLNNLISGSGNDGASLPSVSQSSISSQSPWENLSLYQN